MILNLLLLKLFFERYWTAISSQLLNAWLNGIVIDCLKRSLMIFTRDPRKFVGPRYLIRRTWKLGTLIRSFVPLGIG